MECSLQFLVWFVVLMLFSIHIQQQSGLPLLNFPRSDQVSQVLPSRWTFIKYFDKRSLCFYVLSRKLKGFAREALQHLTIFLVYLAPSFGNKYFVSNICSYRYMDLMQTGWPPHPLSTDVYFEVFFIALLSIIYFPKVCLVICSQVDLLALYQQDIM